MFPFNTLFTITYIGHEISFPYYFALGFICVWLHGMCMLNTCNPFPYLWYLIIQNFLIWCYSKMLLIHLPVFGYLMELWSHREVRSAKGKGNGLPQSLRAFARVLSCTNPQGAHKILFLLFCVMQQCLHFFPSKKWLHLLNKLYLTVSLLEFTLIKYQNLTIWLWKLDKLMAGWLGGLYWMSRKRYKHTWCCHH